MNHAARETGPRIQLTDNNKIRTKMHKQIAVADVPSYWVRDIAKRSGVDTVQLIGTHEHPDHAGSADWSIQIYSVSGHLVASTNGDVVSEEVDPGGFALMLEEYGIDCDGLRDQPGKPLPKTKAEAVAVLRGLIATNQIWHMDDDPTEIFGAEEGDWRAALVGRLNALWSADDDTGIINAGAWAAFEEATAEGVR